MSAINPKDCFLQTKVADLRLICCPGAEELTNLIDNHLVRWANEAGIDKETFIIPAECPRFQSGDAKGLVKESVRGDDIYIPRHEHYEIESFIDGSTMNIDDAP